MEHWLRCDVEPLKQNVRKLLLFFFSSPFSPPVLEGSHKSSAKPELCLTAHRRQLMGVCAAHYSAAAAGCVYSPT